MGAAQVKQTKAPPVRCWVSVLVTIQLEQLFPRRGRTLPAGNASDGGDVPSAGVLGSWDRCPLAVGPVWPKMRV